MDAIGQMRERIEVRTPTVARDEFGGETITWSTLATLWASVEYNTNTSQESQEAERKTATTDARFKIRRRTDITNKMVINYQSQEWDIVAITQTPDYFFTHIEVKNRQ